MIRTYASRSHISFLQVSQFWHELAWKTMFSWSGRIMEKICLLLQYWTPSSSLPRGHVLHMRIPEQVERFFLGEPADTMGKHENTGYMVMDTPDDRTTKTG